MTTQTDRLARIARLRKMAMEYDDPAYTGPAWLRSLGQMDVLLSLAMELEALRGC